MIGEYDLLGLYAPAALVSAIIAGCLVFLARRLLAQTGFYRLVWRPGLFDLALFVVLWAAAARLLEHLHPGIDPGILAHYP